jgi:mycothiol synthase
VLEERPEAVAWLRRRGYEEFERSRTVGLELAGLPGPALAAPPGVEITTLAARPDLVPQVHDVAREALADIPGASADYDAGTLEEFSAGLAHPSTRPEAFFLALEHGRCIGYAELALPGAQPGVAWHGMTGTRRDARGRGVATALKRASIAWATEAGLRVLLTDNNVENAPMRSINEALGYRPRGDSLIMRGRLAPAPAHAP